MTKFAVITGGKVASIHLDDAAGRIEVPEDVFAGFLDNGDGTFSPPVAAPVEEDQVREEAARQLLRLVEVYTAEERGTWPLQVDEASAYLADDTSPVPLIGVIAAARGMSLPDFANLVLAKQAAYKASVSAVLAKQGSLLAQSPIPTDYAIQLAAVAND